MKFLRLVLAMVLLSSVSAVYADNVKIGWINIERIFREAAPAQKATKKLEKEFAARDADLQRLGKQARDLQTSLDRDGLTMSESDRNAKQRELADLNREFQRKQREFREDLNTRRNEELAGIQERANQVIRQIAASEKYDLILSDVIYASPAIDVTDKVLKALADK
ncbi:MAG: OmpH family outer membrane protein [Betaproteobacteria bacterium]|nr:OmpH family outer membrane protein [Betaproteobacteria bacterium]MDE2422822.1 OmpH family outer membrane protein [Betaproteobacteria bacterium]